MKKIAFFLSLLMLLTISTNSVWGEAVSDAINLDLTGITGTSYADWSGKTATSNAVYAGNSAGGNSSIQLRSSNSNSGIVTTTSGGKVRRITVVWNSKTTSGRTLNVYGKNTAYSAATDLYDNSKQGTLIGTLVYNTSTQLNINQDYEYIGFRSASGAMYLTGISVEWETDGTGGGDNPVLESIVVSGTPTKTTYYVGDEFDPTGLTVNGTYSDASTASITSGITWAYNPSQTLAKGQISIGVTATVSEITSAEYNVTGLSVTDPVNYEKVTAEPADWSGEYILVYEADATSARVWKGADEANNYATATIANDIIAAPVGAAVLTIAQVAESDPVAYSIMVGTKYIGQTSDANGIKFQDAAINNSISYNSTDAAVDIVASSAHLRYNSASSSYFRYYKSASYSSQKKIQLYKKSDGKKNTGLAYAEADQKKLTILSETFIAPTLVNPNSLTVSYASNNTDVAEVNASTGAVTIKAAGVAVITASFDGNDDYKAGSASYTIYVTAHAGTEADPYTVADARLAIDCGAGVSGVYATGIVSQIVTAYNEQYGNITYNFSTDGQTTSDQLQAFRGKAKDGKNFTSEDDVQVGDKVVVKGNLTKFNSTYEFAADNQLYSLTRNKEDAGLAYAVTEIEKNIDDAAFTNALTNPHSLAVTYSSSAEVVATIDKNGEVTIVGMGTTTIKATFAGDAAYLAGEASYTLKVNDPSLTKVTFDATVDKGESPLSKSNITLSCSNGVLNNESEYRLYKSSTTTFACSAGNIAMIEFIGVSGNPASGFAAPAEGKFVTDGNNATWTGNATSVSFEASGAQVRATKIFVSYREDTRADAGLSWSTDAIELTVGDAFTAPTLTNPNSIAENEISVESDNTNLATVNAGVVSLIESATGTATITAMFEGNENYKPASVSYTITVNAVGAVKNVVILAKYDDKWYALMNEQGSANNTLNALEVVYSESNGAILNLSAEEQAKIIWKRSISSNKATFKNGTNYITGSSNNTNLTLSANECEWTIDGEHYVIGARTILYNKTGYFKNYATSNVSGSDYSNYVVVLEDPQFLTQSVIRGDLTEGKWGTFCYNQDVEHPTGASFFTIAYVGMENGVPYKVFFDEIGEGESLQAGQPYVYIANDDAIKGVPSGDPVAEGSNDHGFIGVLSDFTFQVSDAASQNKYYVIYDNQIRLCDDGWFKLLAGRAYIDIKDPNLPTQGTASPAPGRRRISLSNPEAPQTATSIDAIESNGKTVKVMIGEQLFILRDGKLYDTTGLLVK